MMILSAIILFISLAVFALGKSPVFRIDRAGIAVIGAALTIGLGILDFDQAVLTIDFRTLVLLFAMMVVTASLKASGFFMLTGRSMIRHLKSRQALLFGVIMASGLLSAFFINDIVCLLFTPIVILVCKKTGAPPIPYLIGLATASNIGSAGTLLGNPQNILIGSVSGVPFLSYFKTAFPIAIAGLIIDYVAIRLFYPSETYGSLAAGLPLPKIRYHRYLAWKSLAVTGFILAGFILGQEPAVTASLGAAHLLVTRRVKPQKIYEGVDFNLLIIFAGLFVIMGGAEQTGLMARIMDIFNPHRFSVFTVLTVALSNIFSNVPAVMLLKTYIPAASGNTWWVGLGVFSTLAGNLTLVGSVANLIVAESAKKHGIKISFSEYLKVGFPLTVFLVVLGLTYFAVVS